MLTSVLIHTTKAMWLPSIIGLDRTVLREVVLARETWGLSYGDSSRCGLGGENHGTR